MSRLILFFLIVTSTAAPAGQISEEERQAAQSKLDQECELARKKALYPMRVKIYQKCQAAGKNEDYCYAKAGEYNGDRVNGSPLFYDLPECKKAFEYRKTHRTRG